MPPPRRCRSVYLYDYNRLTHSLGDEGIVTLKDRLWGETVYTLMGPRSVVVHLPQAMAVAALLGAGEAFTVEAVLVVGAVTALDVAVAPRRARWNTPMPQAQLLHAPLKGTLALRMGGIGHREAPGIVGQNQVKGATWRLVALG